jgi:hypothetical protein
VVALAVGAKHPAVIRSVARRRPPPLGLRVLALAQAEQQLAGPATGVLDLRRTFITVAESADISPIALKCLVNHAIGGDITLGYLQITVERLREPAQRVCDRLMELCGIAAPEGENVARIGEQA